MRTVAKQVSYLAVFFFFSVSFAQQNRIDSLSALLKNDGNHCPAPCIGDTARVTHLNALAWQLSYTNSDSALLLSNQALHLAERILANNENTLLTREIKMGLGVSYYQIGSFYDDKDDYSLSMQSYSQALDLCKKLLEMKSSDILQTRRIRILEATILGNIGIVYRKQSDYPKSLDFYLQALKIDEELGLKNEVATDLGNIGVVYHKLKDLPKTLDYYQRALKMDEESGNKNGVARHLGNIGGVYGDSKDFQKALEYYMKALRITEELQNKGSIARNLGNLGSVYFELKDNEKALDYYLRAQKIKEELGVKSQIVTGLRSIGVLYTATKKYTQANDYLQRSLVLAEELGLLDDMRECHFCLRNLLGATGNFEKALEQMQLATDIKDSIFNMDKDNEITRKEMAYEYKKKEAEAIATQEKKDSETEASSKRQKMILLFVVLGLIVLFVFAGLIFRALRVTRRQKQLIEIRNRQTEEQKKIIEEKNKDIIDSINYAKRIQVALLKEEDYVSSHLPEHFVLYKPKDIVSGDFYWGLEKGKQFYLAAVDCTGHGVPGAFMSMLGIAFLNEINASGELFSPAEILDRLRNKVVKEFRQSGREQETNDGMDISIIQLDLETKKLQWAGANNPLYLIKKGELMELKPDKQSIGYSTKMQAFVNHSLVLETGTTFYLFTDGYADQFGGSKGKKFKYSQLKEQLLSFQDKNMAQQKELLNSGFENWKGQLEQVDDVCLIGVRV